MLRRTLFSKYQVGAHVPPTEAFRGARMKNWPRQKIPSNLEFLPEQRWNMQPIPRDTGKVPRNFVLKMLYFEQPTAVDSLWKKCVQDPECVLESRRHLREVLKQCRDENFIYFEKEYDPHAAELLEEGGNSNTNNSSDDKKSSNKHKNTESSSSSASVQKWMCYLARERFEEVKHLVNMLPDAAGSAMSAGMRGDACDETHASSEAFRELDLSERDKLRHLERLRTQTEKAGKMLNDFQRVELDYIPYTDLNGKVKQMWFYETSDMTTKPKEEEQEEETEEEEAAEPEIVVEEAGSSKK